MTILNTLLFVADDAESTADRFPLDSRLAFAAFVAVTVAYDAAVAVDSPYDMSLAMRADYREAVLGGLSRDC